VVLNQAETPASLTASALGRAEEDSAAATPAMSGGSGEDAAAAQKGALFAGVSGAKVWCGGFGIELMGVLMLWCRSRSR
jgi:hypothetical protein